MAEHGDRERCGEPPSTAAATIDGDDSLAGAWSAGEGPVDAPSAASAGLVVGGLGPLPGVKIGRFVVLDKIGEGGMGRVYAAYDDRLDRRVAIKLLRSHSASATRERRLLGEAQALARINHPNVLQVFEAGEYEGQVAIVMEHIEGVDLRAWLAATPRSWREIVDIFASAGDGLAASHRVGIIHRDFKPSNVVVDGDGRPRVLDYGLAHVAVGGGSEPPAAALLGTPGYIPPEQRRGGEVDGRSDQYSFCVALHEALFGRPPAAASREGEPASRAPRDVRVPSRIVAALARGLALDREARWPSMNALLSELRRDPARTWRRWGLVIGVSALTGATGYAVASSDRGPSICEADHGRLAARWSESRERVERAVMATGVPYAADTWQRLAIGLDRRVGAWEDARDITCQAELADEELFRRMVCHERQRSAIEALVDVLERSDPAVVEHAVRAIEALAPASECLEPSTPLQLADEALDDQEDATIRERLAYAHAYRLAGKYQEGIEVATAAVSEAVGRSPRLRADALVRLGYLQSQAGDDAAAARSLTDAFWAAEVSRHDVVKLEAAAMLVTVLGVHQHRLVEAEHWAQQALAAAELVGLGGREHAAALTSLAAYALAHGRLDESIARSEEALAIRIRLLGEHHTEVALTLNSLGAAFGARGDLDRAELYLERALAIASETVGGEHPLIAGLLNNLAAVAKQRGELERAIRIHEEALALMERLLAPEHPNIAAALNNLGEVYTRAGDLGRARVALERSLELRESAPVASDRHLASTLSNFGELLLREGDLDEAVAHFQRAETLLERSLGPEHIDLAVPLRGLAKVELQRGARGRAVALLERASRIQEAAGSPADWAATLFLLACAAEADDRTRARSLAREAAALYRAAGPAWRPHYRAVVDWIDTDVDEVEPDRRGCVPIEGPS